MTWRRCGPPSQELQRQHHEASRAVAEDRRRSVIRRAAQGSM